MARLALCVVVAAAVLALASAAGPATWKDCTKDGTAKVDTVVINPNPPQAHTNNSVTGQGTLSAPIPTGSTFNVKASYAGLPLLSKSGSVCTNTTISLPLGLGTIYVVGLDCPVTADTLTLTEYAYIDKTPPPGEYDITLTANDNKGNEIVCVSVSWDA